MHQGIRAKSFAPRHPSKAQPGGWSHHLPRGGPPPPTRWWLQPPLEPPPPTRWWLQNGVHNFPTLYKMAMKHLCSSASGAELERLNSRAGALVGSRRTLIEDKRMGNLVMAREIKRCKEYKFEDDDLHLVHDLEDEVEEEAQKLADSLGIKWEKETIIVA